MEKAENVEEYIEMQRAAIASNPECGNSHYNLAVALMGQKKYSEAEEELHTAIDCSPSLAEAYVLLGGICLQRGDLEGCLSFNKRATQSRAAFAEGFGNIGFVELQLGNTDESIVALKKAIAYNPKFLQAFTTLANAYLMKDLVDESIEASKKALDIEPNFAIAHNNLTIAYLEKGDHVSAAEHCEKAIELGYEVAKEIIEEIEQYK